jgi:hypothetical protein
MDDNDQPQCLGFGPTNYRLVVPEGFHHVGVAICKSCNREIQCVAQEQEVRQAIFNEATIRSMEASRYVAVPTYAHRTWNMSPSEIRWDEFKQAFLNKAQLVARTLLQIGRTTLNNLQANWYDQPTVDFDSTKSRQVVKLREQIAELEVALNNMKRNLRRAGETQTVVVDVVTRKDGVFTVAAEVDSVTRTFNGELLKVFNERIGETAITALGKPVQQEIVDGLTKWLKDK